MNGQVHEIPLQLMNMTSIIKIQKLRLLRSYSEANAEWLINWKYLKQILA